MFIKQISVFLENKPGRLAEITGVLAQNDIDISALSIADTTDFGILRLIVRDPQKAKKALSESGATVKITDVLAIKISDKPGGLHEALLALDEEKVAIEYVYAFVGKKGSDAFVVLRTSNPELAVQALKRNDFEVASEAQIYNL